MKLIYLFVSFLWLYSEISTTLAQPRKREGLSLGEKFQFMSGKSLRKPIIRINGGIFKDYIKSSPRNYSVIVMFTAMASQRMCTICSVANDEFQIVANSFRYSQAFTNKLFFGVVDFDEGSDVFNLMRLNTAPTFIHFPPKGKPKPADTMDIQRVGFSAETIAKWIAERTDVQIRVIRPQNYAGSVGIIILITIISGFLYFRRNSLDFSRFKNKTLWGVFSLIFTLAMVSGQMWNHIRSPPFVHTAQNGGIAYIHGSSQAQFISETYIIIALDGLIVLGMILMTESARKKGDVKRRKALAVIGLCLFAIFFSVLLMIFRSKAHGYPFSFLFR
ncbi:UNVERIFIED_CONTAM: hypothetical protein PYX00_010201 [Menopon gallinae]|uniref:Tumor suppressor candidate 3 n=1 Tax=Menopon gallinae TaxID=328185 RepID=A0AAW2HEF9_9NEOP